MSAQCQSCRRPILWAVTPTGARAPMDVSPVENGNVLMLQPSLLSPDYLAVVLSGDALQHAKARGRLWISHWATCQDREEWRRSQREAKDRKQAERVAAEG